MSVEAEALVTITGGLFTGGLTVRRIPICDSERATLFKYTSSIPPSNRENVVLIQEPSVKLLAEVIFWPSRGDISKVPTLSPSNTNCISK